MVTGQQKSNDNVIWSGETITSLFCCDCIKYARRRIGEDLNPTCFIHTVKNSFGVMIWGCRTSEDVGRICVINGNINASKYVNDILQSRLKLSSRDLLFDNEASIFEHNLALYHVSKA